jgi:hypothetical protein
VATIPTATATTVPRAEGEEVAAECAVEEAAEEV